jgi:hypothetical protein
LLATSIDSAIDRYIPIQPLVVRAVHLADLLDDAVVAEGATDERRAPRKLVRAR